MAVNNLLWSESKPFKPLQVKVASDLNSLALLATRAMSDIFPQQHPENSQGYYRACTRLLNMSIYLLTFC
jgi:hypothetical protein